MKQRDWVKELEAKKKEEKTTNYDNRGWVKWYGTTSATNYDVVYYNASTGTGNYYP
jgi:hypothetical protein